MSSAQDNVERLYPEAGAGGFTHVDGTIEFYQRINALVTPHMDVLDFGAGRGEQLLRDQSPYRRGLCKLKGKVRTLVGVDIDDAVLANPFLDEAHVFDPAQPLPFDAGSFDLIYADWVLEHVAEPHRFSAEVRRLLKPGGWFCARTPNRWGMTGLATNLVPNALHVRLLSGLQSERAAQDVFPTVYGLNTLGQLKRHFDAAEWENFSYISNSEPQYVQKSRAMMRLVQLAWRLAPAALHTNLYVFMRRRP